MIRGGQLPKLAECRSCQDPIRFVRMALTGKSMPVNPKPTTGDRPGLVAARLVGRGLTGHVITAERPADPREPYRFTPHYSTCAQQRATTKPAPAEDPALF